MNPVVEINESVDVAAVFRRGSGRIEARPTAMSWRGRDIKFSRLGLCHPVRHGSRLCYIFDVNDGANDYSLEFDTTELSWRLLSLIDGSSL